MKSDDSSDTIRVPSGLFELHPTLDALSTLIYVKDRNLRVVSANRAFYDALGVTWQELVGRTTEQYLGDGGPESSRIDREVLESGTPRLGVVEHYTGPNGLRWVVTDKAPVRGPHGEVVGLVGTSVDITTQNAADERLRRSEAQLSFLTASMADILWTMDLEFRTTYVSPSIERMLGFTPEERKLQRLDEMAAPESAGRILAGLRRELELEASGTADPNRSLTIEVEYYHKNGSTVWTENLVGPIRSANGRLEGLIGVSRNISERRAAEQALRQTLLKYRSLFELSKDAAYLIAADGRFLEVNHAWLDLFGYRRDEVPRLTAADVYEDPSVRDSQFLPAIHRDGELVDWEVRFKKRDGAVMDCLCSVVAHHDDSGAVQYLQGIVRDITAQKKADRALRDSEQRFRSLAENLQDAVVRFDHALRLVYANQAAGALFDIPLVANQGIPLRDLHLPEGVRDLWETTVADVFTAGSSRTGQCEFSSPAGVRYIDWQLIPEKDHTGGVRSVIASIRDITELRDTQEQLRQLALRIQEIREEERTNIARDLHDHFSQELTALKFDLDTLSRARWPEGETVHGRLKGIAALVDQMSQGLRAVISGLRPGMLDDLGLSAAIEWQASAFSERTGITCGLKLEADDSTLPPETATTLFRVLQELLSNVAQHSGATYVSVGTSVTSDSVCLTVRDNGRGITEEQLHSPASLGILAIRERIRARDGTVSFRGEPDKGTTVSITIPLQAENGSWQARLGLH